MMEFQLTRAASQGVRRICRDERGAIAVTFVVASSTLMIAMGMSIDVGTAYLERSRLQSAADAAAIAAAATHDAGSAAQAKQAANAYLTANKGSARGVNIEPPVFTDSYVQVGANASVPTTFLRFAGIGSFDIAVSSKAALGTPGTLGKMEIALVLDITGSMRKKGKDSALRAAAESFVASVQAASKDDPVKISVIPFATRVKVDPGAYRNASWIRFDTSSSEPELQVAQGSWNGCITDRNKPFHDDGGIAPMGSAKLYPAATCLFDSWGKSANNSANDLVPLTANYATLKDKVRNIEFDGCTNLTMGFSWGHAMLSSDGPLKAAATDAHTRKVMVFISDGENTENRWIKSPNSPSYCERATEMDADTLSSCGAAKKDGIDIFTINAIEGDGDVLSECATNKQQYVYIEDASQMGAAFNTILGMIKDKVGGSSQPRLIN